MQIFYSDFLRWGRIRETENEDQRIHPQQVLLNVLI